MSGDEKTPPPEKSIEEEFEEALAEGDFAKAHELFEKKHNQTKNPLDKPREPF